MDEKRVVRIVFKSLLLDLISFTIILPLFPRLLNYYQIQEGGNKATLLGHALQVLEQYKSWISVAQVKGSSKWDTVLLGGLLGSLFSLLQFLVSPLIGRASDRFGRRKVLLWTMIGNIMSTAIWLFARSFVAFLFARVIAGLSEGNVQLSIAIISDITTPERRSRNLAFIGIAFAIAFTFGPALGAWFASFDLTTVYPFVEEWGVYPYSTPALVGLVLLLVETGYLYAYLPETFRHRHMNSSASRSSAKESTEHDNTATRLSNLCYLNAVQCIYSFLFSGMEFTLVFLTFDVLDYTHMQQGKLLGFMGILSALIQGGYVRRRVQRLGEKSLVIQGMVACAMGLAGLSVMAMVPTHASLYLYGSVSCLAFASGTVANCLTSLASLQCHEGEENEPRLAKGRALGEFRSYGQLGRAFGPISACGLYWMMGPTYCYCTGAIAMLLTTVATTAAVPVHKQKKA